MGAKTKSLVIGGIVAVGLITSMQSLDDELASTFAAASSEQAGPGRGAAAVVSEEPIASQTVAVIAAHGSTMLEQAILDAFSASSSNSAAERNRASNAQDFVEASINAKGYLCADAVEMQQAAPGQYGIGCIANRDGSGRAIYLIDSRTGNVDLIS